MAAKLINGNGFTGVTAARDADFYEGIFGTTTGVLDVGEKMRAVMSGNTPRVYDGVILTKEGRRIQIDYGEHVDFTIPTGTSGVTAYYIIGFKLVTNPNDTQTCEAFVQAVSSPTDVIAEEMLKDGNAEVYISLQRITQTGTSNALGERLLPEINTQNRTPVYTSLDKIGIASATSVQNVFAALPDNSMAMLKDSDLTSASLPYTGAHGTVMFIRSDSTRGKVFFYSEYGKQNYQMAMDASGTWYGGWKALPNANDVYYNEGEMPILWAVGGGFLTGGGTQITFAVPLNKQLGDFRHIELFDSNITVRQGNYLMGNGSGGEAINDIGYTYSLILKPNLMIVNVTKASGFGGTNNAPIAVYGYVQIWFAST